MAHLGSIGFKKALYQHFSLAHSEPKTLNNKKVEVGKGGFLMVRDDIKQVLYKLPTSEHPVVTKVGENMVLGKVTRIDFSEETKVCRFHHENGSMTILANTDYLMLRTKSKEEN